MELGRSSHRSIASSCRFRLSVPLAALSFLCIALVTHFRWLIAPMHSDVNFWIRIARDWAHGATLYTDAYDNKLPTVYLFARLIDSSNPALTWYLAEVVYVTGAAVALFAAMRTTAPFSAVVAPLLLIVWTGVMPTGQGTEAIALGLDVIAVSLYAIVAQSGKWWIGLLAGAAAALMVSFRPPTLLHLLAYIPLFYVLCRRYGIRIAAYAAAAFVIGAATIIVAIAAHAMIRGYWAPMLGVLRLDMHYASMARVPLRHALHLLIERCMPLLVNGYAPGLLAMVTIISAAWRSRETAQLSSWRLWLIVSGLWLLAALAGTLPGGRAFIHYYHVIWAPMSVLGALWLDILFRKRPIRSFGLPLAGALIVFTVAYAALDLSGAAIRQAHAGLALGTNQLVRPVAADLNDLIPPNEIAPICVWGHWSELYWRVPRRSVTPAMVPIIFLEIAPELFDQWTAAMLESRPSIIVFDEWGFGPTSRWRYLYAGRPGVAELQAMLTKEYVEIRRWHDLYILARRGSRYDVSRPHSVMP